MRKIITNILTTTAISLLVLSLIALCYRAKFLCIESVFQAFFANILIHLGIKWMQRIDFNYPIAESLLSIGYTIMVALVCGKVFHWYDSMPVQVLALLAGIVYIVGASLSVIQLKREVNDINVLLQKHKEKRK